VEDGARRLLHELDALIDSEHVVPPFVVGGGASAAVVHVLLSRAIRSNPVAPEVTQSVLDHAAQHYERRERPSTASVHRMPSRDASSVANETAGRIASVT
jgi:hypothetical protein